MTHRLESVTVGVCVLLGVRAVIAAYNSIVPIIRIILRADAAYGLFSAFYLSLAAIKGHNLQ